MLGLQLAVAIVDAMKYSISRLCGYESSSSSACTSARAPASTHLPFGASRLRWPAVLWQHQYS